MKKGKESKSKIIYGRADTDKESWKKNNGKASSLNHFPLENPVFLHV